MIKIKMLKAFFTNNHIFNCFYIQLKMLLQNSFIMSE